MKQILPYPSYIIVLLFLVINLSANSQVLEKTAGKLTTVDYTRLSYIDTVIQEYLAKDWTKGVVTLFVKDNKIIQHKGYGYADAATKKPMLPNSLFRIMSQTKAITSVGIMMLYEKGKFLLDDPIGNFIPEFKNQVVIDTYNAADTTYTTVPAKRAITFRDLLTHTSGIDYAAIGTANMRAIYAKAGLPSGLGKFDTDLLTEMKKLAKLPLAFQPGDRFQYGLNTDLLGSLIEVISGQTLEVYFHENIFSPLGMTDTYFNLPPSKANRLTTVYTEDAANKIIAWSPTFRNIDPAYPTIPTTYFSGGAGLTSTAYDYAVFLQMLLNGGIYNGKRLLAPRTIELMTSNQLNFPFNKVNGFGLGFEIITEKGATQSPKNEGTFSWGGYYGTTYWADPKAGIIGLVMTQHTPNSHGDLSSKITSVLYASLTNKP